MPVPIIPKIPDLDLSPRYSPSGPFLDLPAGIGGPIAEALSRVQSSGSGNAGNLIPEAPTRVGTTVGATDLGVTLSKTKTGQIVRLEAWVPVVRLHTLAQSSGAIGLKIAASSTSGGVNDDLGQSSVGFGSTDATGGAAVGENTLLHVVTDITIGKAALTNSYQDGDDVTFFSTIERGGNLTTAYTGGHGSSNAQLAFKASVLA